MRRIVLNARGLRKNATDAELALWRYLRDSRLNGYKFKRQQPIGQYIADFVCLEARLIVEVDGGQHVESEADRTRDVWLRSQNFRVLRFWNDEVLQNVEGVLERIVGNLPPHPSPSPARGEGFVGK